MDKLFDDRRWLLALIIINMLGAVYGFNWYKLQLAGTPLMYWPVVPDSPLSSLLFGFMLALLYLGRRYPLLEAIASLSVIKYGLWTPFVIGQHWSVHSTASFEDVHLFLSHLGMAAEGLLFIRRYPLQLRAGLVAVGWLAFNDYMDYFQSLHPVLPAPELVDIVKWVAFSFTALMVALLAAFRS